MPMQDDSLKEALIQAGILASNAEDLESRIMEVAGGAGDSIHVLSTDSPSTIKSKVETLNPEQVNNSPEGRGRMVVMPARGVDTGPMSLSTMQSLSGVKGSSIVNFNPSGLSLSPGEHGHLVLANDSLSRNGIRGNGVLRDLDFNGGRQLWEGANPGLIVNGYWAPDRVSGKCISHRIDNVAFYNYTGHGVYIGSGNDQLVATRLRSEGSKGFAVVLKSSDIKGNHWGCVGQGGALLVDGAAPEIETVDMFIPSDFEGEGTVHLVNAARTQIKGGTISGRTIIDGRNDQGTGVRFESSGIMLSDLAFKHDKDLANTRFYSGAEQIYVYDSYIEIRDADDVRLRSPRFGFDTTLAPSALPDYLIKIVTSTGNNARLGFVYLAQAIGMIDFTGRPGDSNGLLERIGCKKHWSNRPDLTIFDWGTPGQVEVVPNWRCDHPDPALRTHVRFDGTSRLKADFKFGYLCATIDRTGAGAHGTLDDANTSFTLPRHPVYDSENCRAMRVRP